LIGYEIIISIKNGNFAFSKLSKMNHFFEHFIITQFNLLQFPKSSVSDNDSWFLWTRKRFAIFWEYCFPSVLQQKTKQFKWLIYFDTATPSEFNEQISELQKYDFINICYADKYDDFNFRYMKDVQQKASPDTQWFITSRLDNDDCLHCSAMERIQKEFAPNDKFMISLSLGYVLDMESRKMSKYCYPMSPFISLVEKNTDSMLGIYHKEHASWNLKLYIFKELYNRYFVKKEKRNVCFVLDEILWIQLYHKENVSNSFYRGFPVLRSNNLISFGLNVISTPSSFWMIPKYYNYVMWKRYFKAFMVRVLG